MASVTATAGRLVRDWATRRLARGPGPMTLDRRRIYILPTRYGLMYAALVFVMLLGAMNYTNSMVFALTFLLAGQGLVAMYHTHRNLLGLSVAPAGAEPPFAGQPAVFYIRLDNASRRARLGVGLVSPDGSTRHADIPAGEAVTLTLRVATERRGRLALPRFVVATRHPLTLFRAWSWVILDAETVVYPAPPERAPPVPAGRDAHGEESAAVPGGHDDFYGLRKYHRGDSFRHIAWKAVARELDVMTKQFADTHDERRWLDWDLLVGRDADTRAAIICRWVLDSEAAGIAYGLRLPGRELPPDRGDAHRRRCLEALAVIDEDGPERRVSEWA